MLPQALVWSSLLAAAAAVGTVKNATIFGCGTPSPNEEFHQITRRFAEQEMRMSSLTQKRETFKVKVYVNVIHGGKTAESGYLPVRYDLCRVFQHAHLLHDMWLIFDFTFQEDAIRMQINQTNKHFASAGFHFTITGKIRYIPNQKWAFHQDEHAMKHQLKRGGYGDLNLYFLAKLTSPNDPGGQSSTILGSCYLPIELPIGYDFKLDGCSIISQSVPNSGSHSYFESDTPVTHEIGHWLGLLHTFEEGCGGEGDKIDDTPAQKGPTWGCPKGHDIPNSCGKGLDPVDNYMDYASHPCPVKFTEGQIRRMHNMWRDLRQGKHSGDDGDGNPGENGHDKPDGNWDGNWDGNGNWNGNGDGDGNGNGIDNGSDGGHHGPERPIDQNCDCFGVTKGGHGTPLPAHPYPPRPNGRHGVIPNVPGFRPPSEWYPYPFLSRGSDGLYYPVYPPTSNTD
ncbi:hypothetical protein QQS21_005413 [Conoideocrella luteorostrata]|uniref:Peptidase M43 pregnancy-associated plasma-A domain-containing protein n=1 Tax=Conoideocrella luteorostrata TaxID=1105319 RepID=A0AAJ0FZ23_9HYPO|nr:hypothetical protein QQS21_005413 [Conoideocrella luteorostrata]